MDSDRVRGQGFWVRGRLVTASIVALALVARRGHAGTVTEVHYTMGTYFTITVLDAREADARAAMRRCFADARRLEAVFSRYDSTSELSRLNASHATVSTLSDDMAELLDRALTLRAVTGGTFDVTIGGLTALWRERAVWPVNVAPNATRTGVQLRGHDLLRVDPTVQLDFDGIAKGFAVDRCVALLRTAGVRRALVSLGESSQYALGAPAGESGWPIAVRGVDSDTTIGTIRLRDQALSVSSVFGHNRTVGTRRIGHIIDPASGRPLRSDALALVVADNATDAEAYSKAVLIWGARPELAGATHASPLQGIGARHRFQAALYIANGLVATWRDEAMHFTPAPRSIRAAEEPLR
jgi:thiamine biosynthesis lipoprotein